MSPLFLLGYAAALAVLAVTWAVVLVDAGMLLAPVQRGLRAWYNYVDAAEQPLRIHRLDDQWWWKPLWGCYRCVAGQWGLWGYLLLIYRHHAPYSLFQHLVFTAGTLLLACIINKLYQWTNQ